MLFIELWIIIWFFDGVRVKIGLFFGWVLWIWICMLLLLFFWGCIKGMKICDWWLLIIMLFLELELLMVWILWFILYGKIFGVWIICNVLDKIVEFLFFFLKVGCVFLVFFFLVFCGKWNFSFMFLGMLEFFNIFMIFERCEVKFIEWLLIWLVGFGVVIGIFFGIFWFIVGIFKVCFVIFGIFNVFCIIGVVVVGVGIFGGFVVFLNISFCIMVDGRWGNIGSFMGFMFKLCKCCVVIVGFIIWCNVVCLVRCVDCCCGIWFWCWIMVCWLINLDVDGERLFNVFNCCIK